MTSLFLVSEAISWRHWCSGYKRACGMKLMHPCRSGPLRLPGKSTIYHGDDPPPRWDFVNYPRCRETWNLADLRFFSRPQVTEMIEFISKKEMVLIYNQAVLSKKKKGKELFY